MWGGGSIIFLGVEKEEQQQFVCFYEILKFLPKSDTHPTVLFFLNFLPSPILSSHLCS